MKLNYRKLIEDCIETGIERGWREEYNKHTEEDSNPELIKDTIHDCIMEQFYEYFIFDNEFND